MYKKMTSVFLLALYCLTSVALFAKDEDITDAGNTPIGAYPGDRGIYPALRSREEHTDRTARERRRHRRQSKERRENRHKRETLRQRRERIQAQNRRIKAEEKRRREERERRERRERRRARGEDRTPYGGMTNRRTHAYFGGYHA